MVAVKVLCLEISGSSFGRLVYMLSGMLRVNDGSFESLGTELFFAAGTLAPLTDNPRAKPVSTQVSWWALSMLCLQIYISQSPRVLLYFYISVDL